MRFVLLAASAALFAAPALAGDDLEFKLTNASHSDMKAFYVSHVGANSWEDNLIAGGVVPAGHAVKVIVADGRTTCQYDIRATFDDGSETDDRNIDLCRTGGYVVRDAS